MNRALIAENHICISRALFKEGMSATGSRTYKKTVRRLALILLLLYLAVAGWLLCTGGSLVFLIGESIFLGALLFWLLVMLPGTRRRSKYKAMTPDGSMPPKRTVKFYPDCLTVIADTGKETSIPYCNVTDWLETRNLYILNCNNKTSVLLDKNGFVTGDFNAVKSTLKKQSFSLL